MDDFQMFGSFDEFAQSDEFKALSREDQMQMKGLSTVMAMTENPILRTCVAACYPDRRAFQN
jgi:hypothetical protein